MEDAAVAPNGLARCRQQQSELLCWLASFRHLSLLSSSLTNTGAAMDKDGGGGGRGRTAGRRLRPRR